MAGSPLLGKGPVRRSYERLVRLSWKLVGKSQTLPNLVLGEEVRREAVNRVVDKGRLALEIGTTTGADDQPVLLS